MRFLSASLSKASATFSVSGKEKHAIHEYTYVSTTSSRWFMVNMNNVTKLSNCYDVVIQNPLPFFSLCLMFLFATVVAKAQNTTCFMSIFMVPPNSLHLDSGSLLFIQMNLDNDHTHITNLWPAIGHNRCWLVLCIAFDERTLSSTRDSMLILLVAYNNPDHPHPEIKWKSKNKNR